MISEQLKRSILQAAIQGKLTEQLTEDGDAHDLFKEVQKQKALLIKAGKIKKEESVLEITEDMLPFDIPENWCWVRLGEITEINPRNKIEDETPVSFIPMTLIEDGYSNAFQYKTQSWKDVKSGFTHFADNDVVVAKITPCFQNRKSAVMRDLINGYGAGTTELHVLRPLTNSILSDYILFLVKTEYFISNGASSMTGTAGQQRVGAKYIYNFLCPLPPVNEQKRIIKRLTEIIPKVQELESNETSLDILQKAFPQKMKHSILQYAIQGNLTEQLQSDGDARDLLEEIQNEKTRLIKEGKIKKEKPIPEIMEDVVPFDIPENWCWVRLGDIAKFQTGKLDSNASVKNGKYPFFTCSKEVLSINSYSFDCEALLLAGNNAQGKYDVKHYKGKFDAYQRTYVIFPTVPDTIDFEYLKIFLEYMLKELQKKSLGSLTKYLTIKIILPIPCPLPPIPEQKRIVEKVNSLMKLCVNLEEEITEKASLNHSVLNSSIIG